MTIKVFGQLQDVIQQQNISVEEAKDLNELKQFLNKLYPSLAEKKFVIAVDRTIIHDNISLPENAEIALLPPFSGG